MFIANQCVGYLVRGSTKFEYHAQNYRDFREELKKRGFGSVLFRETEITAKKDKRNFRFVCRGGGRIEHNYNGTKCSIYGFSKAYGRADHEKTQTLIAEVLGYPKATIFLNQKHY
jgi:hypothetical protein